MLKELGLSRIQKEQILVVVPAAHRNTYCTTDHAAILQSLGATAEHIDRLLVDPDGAGLPTLDRALLDFGLWLDRHPTRIERKDIDGLRREGLSDTPILEAILVTGLTNFLCTLSEGLDVEPGCPPRTGGCQRHRIGPLAWER